MKLPHGMMGCSRQTEWSSTFTRGTGKASKLPAKLFKLGWKPPGKDTNSYKNVANGFSITVPQGYVVQKKRPPGMERPVALFRNKQGMFIAVSCHEIARPIDADEYVPRWKGGMRASDPQFEVVEQNELALAGNVPGVLLTCTRRGGKWLVLALLAFDGPRIFELTAVGRPGMKQRLPELRDAFQNLRVFEADYTKPP